MHNKGYFNASQHCHPCPTHYWLHQCALGCHTLRGVMSGDCLFFLLFLFPFISPAFISLLFPFLLPPCLFSFSIISYIAVSILFPVAGLLMSLSSSYIVSHWDKEIHPFLFGSPPQVLWGLLKVFLPKACAQRSLCRQSLAQSFEATAIGSVTRVNLTNIKESVTYVCDCDRDRDLLLVLDWTNCWVLDFLELTLT